jgi:hypothetical protein
MRDLLNILDDILTEANLGSGEIPPQKLSAVINPKTKKPFTRPELFLHKVKTGSAFVKDDDSGEEVVINPAEAKAVAAWLATGPKGTITMRTMDGGTVKNTQLKKTVEFGSKEAETIKIKPSDVFATTPAQVKDFGNSIDTLLQAGGFPASEMYNKISTNPALVQMGKLGDAVIYMARQANEGQVPVFPPDLKKDETKAIELYASEYLGALGLVTGAVPFIRGSREQFEEFVGSSLADMIMFFPKASNNPLADSFSVVNDANGHAVKISSKAAGKGAPPALGSMKLPAEVRDKYPEAAEFLDIAQDPALTQFTQPFAMMNHLYLINPNKVPKAYHQMLPFDSDFVGEIEDSMKTGQPLARSVMSRFAKQLSDKVKYGSASDGGKAWYAVTADVMRAVNSDRAVPDLRAALIESLGYNFIQLYTNVKGNKLVTEAFWPAKISGQVKLKTKGSAGEIKGKMSVEISPGGADIDPGEIPGVKAQDSSDEIANLDTDTLDKAVSQPRLRGPGAKAAKQSEPRLDKETLGRARRGR